MVGLAGGNRNVGAHHVHGARGTDAGLLGLDEEGVGQANGSPDSEKDDKGGRAPSSSSA